MDKIREESNSPSQEWEILEDTTKETAIHIGKKEGKKRGKEEKILKGAKERATDPN